MAASSRHEEVLECLRDIFLNETEDCYLYDEIRIQAFQEDNSPSTGITLSPMGEREQLGTNERDDIEYATLITRAIHALDEEDRKNQSEFRVSVRKAFHNKRIECGDGCWLYSRVDFGQFAIPSAWKQDNMSVAAMTVYTLARESR